MINQYEVLLNKHQLRKIKPKPSEIKLIFLLFYYTFLSIRLTYFKIIFFTCGNVYGVTDVTRNKLLCAVSYMRSQ